MLAELERLRTRLARAERASGEEGVEAELRASVEWQDAIIEGSRDAIFISDEDSRFVRVNSAACELTGYSADELLRMRIPDLHEDVDLHAYRSCHAAIMAGEPAITEADVLRKDGTKVSVEFNNSRIAGAGVPFMHTVARDMTAWKRAQEELRDREQELRTILESTADGILVVDQRGGVIHANRRFRDLWKIPETVMDTRDDGALLDSILHELVDPEGFLSAVRRLYASADPSLDTIQFLDGRIFERYSAPLLDGEELLGRVWSFRDVTERQRAEDALVDSRLRLRSLARRLDSVREEERTSLARELHDEVGQALTAMRMDLSVLEKSERREHLVDRIHSMIDLTEDALQRVNRMSVELRSPLLEILGLRDAVEAHVGDFQEHSGIEVELGLQDLEMPECFERDLAAFRILQESLMNVRRHAKASRVQVGLSVAGDRLVLEVADDGVGVTAPQLRDHNSLGLIGMQERAERLAGSVEINRRREGGTRVRAELPVNPPEP